MHVLLIEDDNEISKYIVKGFKENGHNIDTAFNGKDGLFLAQSEKFDVIILDRMLPEMDGITILRNLRHFKNETPVLILSALKEIDDKVLGLKVGGDDYLVKPFAFSELLARTEALHRRKSKEESVKTILEAEDLKMDLLSRKVTRGNIKISLQPREFRLLEFLLRNKGNLVTRTMLLEKVWDYHFDPQTNVTDVHISRLRNKIDKGFENQIIKTIRGAGYIIE